MRTRLIKSRPPHSKHKSGSSVDQLGGAAPANDAFVSILSPESARSSRSTPASTPTKSKPARPSAQNGSPSRTTLSLVSSGAVNAMTRPAAAANGFVSHGKPAPPMAAANSSFVSSPLYSNSNTSTPSAALGRMNSTIRTVRSFEDRDRFSEDSGTESTPASLSASRNSAFSSSVNSNASASGISSVSSQPQQPSSLSLQQKLESSRTSNGNRRGKQSYLTATTEKSSSTLETPRQNRPSVETGRSSIEIPARESSLSATTMNMGHGGAEPAMAAAAHDGADGANGWDSTVGKAGLGKTGRVINKLVSDNEALKRDIQIERLRAEESKQSARLLEDKMDRLVSDYESRLLEASVTKTLLARKERQVEALQSTVDLERKRAVDAGERERVWKEEMEKVRADAKRQVEEASNHATLMEGRYNAISSHWRDQGEEVRRAMTKMKAEIGKLVEERRQDDDKIDTLRDLCDQQDGNIRDLKQQKEDIIAQFERYKQEQEQMLRDIKTKARQREEEQERTIEESREVLDKLKWALNVKENIGWAK